MSNCKYCPSECKLQSTLPQSSRTKVHEELLAQGFNTGVLTAMDTVEGVSLVVVSL